METSGAGTALVIRGKSTIIGQTADDQRVDRPGHVAQVRDLRREHQDAEGVDEADHHRARHEPHQPGHAERAQHDLEDAGQDDGGDKVAQPVLAGDRRDDQSDRAGGGGDHRRPSADERDDHRHGARREQPDLGVHAGDDRERDRLGDQRQTDHQTGQHLGTAHRGTGEPGGLTVAKGRGERQGTTCPARARRTQARGGGHPGSRTSSWKSDPAAQPRHETGRNPEKGPAAANSTPAPEQDRRRTGGRRYSPHGD